VTRHGCRYPHVAAAGAGLIETLLAIALALSITLASLRVMAMSNGEYLQVEQALLMDEQAEYVLELANRLLQQVGHVDPSRPSTGAPARLPGGALQGLDNATSTGGGADVQGARPGAHFGSDLMALYRPGDEGQRMLNCAGSPASLVSALHAEHGWSWLYVAPGVGGEQELRCRYWTGQQWSTQSLAVGVAGLQLLYGVDSDRDGLPNDFLSASQLRAIDVSRPGGPASIWTHVVAVHLALLLRSPQTVPFQRPRLIDLFGTPNALQDDAQDPGVRLPADKLDANRLWRRYDSVIFLNNSLGADA